MKEENLVFYEVTYPKDFCSQIKKTGKYDILKLAKEGMLLSFDIIRPKEEVQKVIDNFAKMFYKPSIGVIICDIDEWVENANKAIKFAHDTGRIGELPLILFDTIQYLTDVYSKERQKEIDEEYSERKPSGSYYAHKMQILNESAEKKGLEHWILLIATHKYFTEEYYLSNLLEVHRQHVLNLINKEDKKKRKNKKQVIVKEVIKEVTKPFVIKTKQKDKPNIEISSDRFPLTSANVKDRKYL